MFLELRAPGLAEKTRQLREIREGLAHTASEEAGLGFRWAVGSLAETHSGAGSSRVGGDARSGGPRGVVERCVSLATRDRLRDSGKVWVKSDEAEWGIGSAERRGPLEGAVQEQRGLVAGWS